MDLCYAKGLQGKQTKKRVEMSNSCVHTFALTVLCFVEVALPCICFPPSVPQLFPVVLANGAPAARPIAVSDGGVTMAGDAAEGHGWTVCCWSSSGSVLHSCHSSLLQALQQTASE